MGTNTLKKVLLITAIPLLFAASCNKDKTMPCVNTAYSFAVTAEITPQRMVYNVGDTIFLTSSFSKTLMDLVGNYNFDYSNSVGISGNLNALKMDTINHVAVEGLNNFEVLNFIGSTTPISNSPNLGVNIFFVEQPSIYNAKFGLKLKSKGIFYIGVTNLASKGIQGKNCTNAGFDMTVTNSNKNFNLFQYALGYTPDALLQKTIYCFRVQ